MLRASSKKLSRSLFSGFLSAEKTCKYEILAVKNFSSGLSEREKGQEYAYIHRQEELNKLELKKKLEKILDRHEEDLQRAEVISMLEKAAPEPAEKGIIGRLGLDSWKFALPVGIILSVPLLVNEIVVISVQTQILGVFIFAVAGAYQFGGGMVASALDDYSKQISDDLKKVDEKILSNVHASIAENEKLFDLEQELKSLHELVDSAAEAQVIVLNNQQAHIYHEKIHHKLEALKSVEDSVATSVRNRMVDFVSSDVLKTFQTDKKVKELALEQAIAALASGPQGTMGKDIIGDAFTASFKSYREKYSKLKPEDDEILVQLKKDMSVIATAPALTAKGGNVYETHRLM